MEVLLLRNKSDGTYSYVNVTKGHICPCRFTSIAEAITDLDQYPKVLKYTVTESIKDILYKELKELAYEFSKVSYNDYYSTQSYQSEKNNLHTKAMKLFDILNSLEYSNEIQTFIPYCDDSLEEITEDYFYPY